MKRYDTVIFDLDGTLLNTLADLKNAANHALRKLGYPERTLEEIRQFVGNGARLLMQRATGSDDDQAIDEALLCFKAYYSQHSNDLTAPYPGILALLEDLAAQGVQLAVVSNKPDPQVKSLCKMYFGHFITQAAGDREGVPRKPAPDAVLSVMDAFHADPVRTLYVGDSDVDVITAHNAGVDCAAVLWGFRTREEIAPANPEMYFDSARALGDAILDR